MIEQRSQFGIRSVQGRCRSWRRVVASLALVLLGLVQMGLPRAAAIEEPGAPPTSQPASGSSQTTSVPASRQATNVAIITIEGMITSVTSHSVRRRMQEAVDGGADCLVFDLNTPGGEVGAVLEITGAIKSSPITNTIAWVNPDAYSGGAIIALACREIVVAPNATMGDAAPIAIDPLRGVNQLAETERAKALAPLVTELVDSARMNGYDENLVISFIALHVELWGVEEKATGKKYFLTKDEYRDLYGEKAPKTAPRIPSIGSGAAASAESELVTDEFVQDEALEPAADRSREFQSPTPALPNSIVNELNSATMGLQQRSRRPDFSQRDPSEFGYLGRITDGTSLLTLKEDDLKYYGFAQRTIANDQELKTYLGAQNLRRLDRSWSEHMVAFMTTGASGMITRGLLIIIFLMAMFIELSMPGAGLPGMIALLALGGLIIPPILIGAHNWWALASILGGIGLILVEILIIPGFGLPGIGGLLLLLVGLVATFAKTGELFPGMGRSGGEELAWAVAIVLLAVFAAGVGMYFFSRYTHVFPLAGRMVLNTPASGGLRESLLGAMGPERASSGPVAAGAIGTAVSSLRPSGTADFDGTLLDVVSEYGFVAAGGKVRVVSADSFNVIVEPVAEAGASAGPEKTA